MSSSGRQPVWRLLLTVAIGAAAGLQAGVRGATPERVDAKTAGFAVIFHGERSTYVDVAVAAMPGAAVIFDVVGPAGAYSAKTADDGTLVQQSAHQWRWTAPDRPGTYELKFKGPGSPRQHDEIVVHAFVMVPASRVSGGLLNGYRIGMYPSPLKGKPLYTPPPGFIEVTRENQDTKVSPHFTLKQFLCKEDTTREYPKYLVLNERLPLKLEAVLERVNEVGFKVDTLNVMSAYRTPYYNHAIGDVPYSMHQWGSAADVYVDPQKKNRMEDLNRDGRVDVQDAKFLYDEIDAMLAGKAFRHFQGGMGYYPATSAHPPFVHVDVRGTAARWKG
jgi:hypothetical protein